MSDNILEMKHITKEFPGVKALDDVSLSVLRGEIHAVVGENGAGKSTLMNVLSGIYPHGSYDGEIFYDGHLCRFSKIKDSENCGIVIIHQELALVPYLTIAENMFLGNERGSSLAIDWDETFAKADELLQVVGLRESSHTLIKDISVGKQQLVEIAKALSKNVKLLILDEPTASLNESDSMKLLDLLKEFKKKGVTSIIISHKLNEIAYVADRITIIRDGAVIETLDMAEGKVDEARIIRGMVGRELTNRFPAREHRVQDEVVLEVEHWSVKHALYADRTVVDDVSFYVKRGEVVGIAGLMGAGAHGARHEHLRQKLRFRDHRHAEDQRKKSNAQQRTRRHPPRASVRNGGPQRQRPDPLEPNPRQHDARAARQGQSPQGHRPRSGT